MTTPLMAPFRALVSLLGLSQYNHRFVDSTADSGGSNSLLDPLWATKSRAMRVCLRASAYAKQALFTSTLQDLAGRILQATPFVCCT